MSDAVNQTILIVDDVPENLQVIVHSLEPYEYAIHSAENGRDALAIAASEKLDLILLDVMMPDMDGFAVCEHLKADPATAETPVIFITAKTDTNSMVRGFKAGGVDYITKPLQVDERRARGDTHLRLCRRERKLKEPNAAKDRFISIISHEMKAPLGGINAFLATMEEQFETMSITEIWENLHLLRQASDNFMELVNNLLDWSTIQVGMTSYRPHDIELIPVTEDIQRLFEIETQRNGMRWEIEMPENIQAHADLEMVETILRNLVSNAVKYSWDNGLVRIKASEDEQEITICIEDTGRGIASDDQKKLFRLDEGFKLAGCRGEMGTGMGLILCKECVDRHSGRIWVESEIDLGTKVCFTLPKAKS